MRMTHVFAGSIAGLALLAGCETVPEGVERGPDGTVPYTVTVEASDPGVRIEANGEFVGVTPLTFTIYGDKDGTFHDFGSYEYVIQAFPVRTNQYVQTRVFGTGRMFTPQDRIPRRIYFDMNQPPITYVPRSYGAPYYPYPYSYPYPYPYPAPYFYGPRIYIAPPLHHHHHHNRHLHRH